MSTEQNGDDGAAPEEAILAGEYVMGLLDGVHHAAAERRVADDPAFAREVDFWRDRLAPLDAAYVPVAPPADAFARIERRLFPLRPGAKPAMGGAWSGANMWRALALGSTAALVVLLWFGLRLPTAEIAQGQRLVAALAADGSPVRLIALYDSGVATLTLSTLAGEAGAGSDFELWLIAGNRTPVSLGVLPHAETAAVPIAAGHRALFAAGVTIAVSREPAGGSPTGAPTGPVVAAGSVREM